VKRQHDHFVVSAVCLLSTTQQFTEDDWVATSRVKNIQFPFCSLAAPGFYSDYYKHFLREEYYNAIFSLPFSFIHFFRLSLFPYFLPSWFLFLIFIYLFYFIYLLEPVAYRGGLGGSTPPPPPKFRRPSKIVPNATRL